MHNKDRCYEHIGELVSAVHAKSKELYATENRRYEGLEEFWVNRVIQLQTTLIERAGGRLTVHITVTPRNNRDPEMYYYRFQYLKGLGYMEVHFTTDSARRKVQ